jgi:hypothetical protein
MTRGAYAVDFGDGEADKRWIEKKKKIAAERRARKRDELERLAARVRSVEAVAERAATNGDERLCGLLRRLRMARGVAGGVVDESVDGRVNAPASSSSSSSEEEEDEESEEAAAEEDASASASDDSNDDDAFEFDDEHARRRPSRGRRTPPRASPVLRRREDAIVAEIRVELAETKRERDAMRRDLEALRAQVTDRIDRSARPASASSPSQRPSPSSLSRVKQLASLRLEEAERAATAATEVAADHKRETTEARARLRACERARAADRVAADDALRSTRAELKKSQKRASELEDELYAAKDAARIKLKRKDDAIRAIEKDLDDALDRCGRAEALNRDLRRESEALMVETRAASRKCDAQAKETEASNARRESAEHELARLRKWAEAQRKDLESAVRLASGVDVSRSTANWRAKVGGNGKKTAARGRGAGRSKSSSARATMDASRG